MANKDLMLRETNFILEVETEEEEEEEVTVAVRAEAVVDSMVNIVDEDMDEAVDETMVDVADWVKVEAKVVDLDESDVWPVSPTLEVISASNLRIVAATSGRKDEFGVSPTARDVAAEWRRLCCRLCPSFAIAMDFADRETAGIECAASAAEGRTASSGIPTGSSL